MAHSNKIGKILKQDKAFKERDDAIALYTKEQARVGGKKPNIFFSDTGSKTSGEHGKGHRIIDTERNRKRYKKLLTKKKEYDIDGYEKKAKGGRAGYKGGGMSQRGLGRAFMKGGKV